MKLTSKQLDDFNTHGFIVIKNFAPTILCDEIYSKALMHLSRSIPPVESEAQYQNNNNNNNNTHTIRRLRQVYDREDIFSHWMKNNEIRPALKQIINEDPVLVLAHHNSIMTKQPHKSSITSWHQDIRYWNFQNDRLVSIWLSLGDEVIENGLLEFIPGSHKMNFNSEQFDKNLSFREDTTENQDIISKRIHVDLKQGDVVIFHAKTLHYAHQNLTDKTKFSFVYSVRAASNLPIKGSISDYKEVRLESNK